MAFIIGIILGAATLIFVFQNMMIVTVNFLGWHIVGNLTFILVICVLIGMIISWLFSIPQLFELSHLNRMNRRLARELEEKKLQLSKTEGKLAEAKTPVIVEKTTVVEDTSL